MLAAEALSSSTARSPPTGATSTAPSRLPRGHPHPVGAGADRQAAQLWFELGGLLEEIGAADEAMDAYRRAAASTGLTVRRSTRTQV